LTDEVCSAGSQWLTPVILVTWEAEIRRIMFQSQPQANSSKDPVSKKPITEEVCSPQSGQEAKRERKGLMSNYPLQRHAADNLKTSMSNPP
jgi:hypothetical protein